MVTWCLGLNSEVHLKIHWLIQLYLSNSWSLFDIRLNLLQPTHEFIWSHPDNLPVLFHPLNHSIRCAIHPTFLWNALQICLVMACTRQANALWGELGRVKDAVESKLLHERNAPRNRFLLFSLYGRKLRQRRKERLFWHRMAFKILTLCLYNSLDGYSFCTAYCGSNVSCPKA